MNPLPDHGPPEAVHYPPLREIVAERIRIMILGGTLSPGERLFEGQIAEDLGVSRNPVREAILSLQSTGLVQVVPRKGTYVAEVDFAELRHLQEVRYGMESFAAELAAKRRTDDDLAALRDCIEEGSSATKAGDSLTAAAAHRRFHVLLERAAHNPCLERVLEPLRQQSELTFSVLQDERASITWDEHRSILDAVSNRHGAQARRLMQKHIASAIRMLERAGPTAAPTRRTPPS